LDERRFSIPDRSGHLLGNARRDPCDRDRGVASVDARRHADQLREASAERAERRTTNGETHLGDAEITPPQQGHRPLDAAGHQIAVRRLAVRQLELTAQVTGRHVRPARECLDVERLRVVAIDAIAHPAQQREITQALHLIRFAGHPRDRATTRR
jgi:hypothetical protein